MLIKETGPQVQPMRLSRWWFNYKFFVENNTRGNMGGDLPGIAHWRDQLFTDFITYLMPVCLIALVPGVIVSIAKGFYLIAIFDVMAPLSIAVIALNIKLKLNLKKVVVLSILYSLAVALLICLGLFGPSMIYLLALSLLVTLFFPNYFAYWSVLINFIICFGCWLIVYLKLFNSPLIVEYELGVWIAVSSNLIFLSWICTVLMSKTIKSLDNEFEAEHLLKGELQKEAIYKVKIHQLLAESETHYKGLFDQSPSPMWVIDNKTWKFLQVNDAAVAKYGYSHKEFLNLTIRDIKMEKDIDQMRKDLKSTTLTGSTLCNITQHRRKSGVEFYVEVRFNAIMFNGKNATLTIARDMTEQIEFTKAIETQNRRLNEIAWMQSHVVRAPLARIMGLVDIITQGEEYNPEMFSYLDASAKEFDGIIKEIINNTENV